MSLPKINPIETTAWKELSKHFTEIEHTHLRELFSEENERASNLSISWENFYLDYSKNRVTAETMQLLQNLAQEVRLSEAIKAQFDGSKINETENRAVSHTALRNFDAMPPEVRETLAKMAHFSEQVITETHVGYTGKPITDVVNVGIGGSHLGPNMVNEALQYYKNHLKVHFMSNVDGDHVSEILKKVDPETTLFVIVSKTFTTQETITNAKTVRAWFCKTSEEKHIDKHFVAVSTNLDAVASFGIAPANIFPMWDWVGGRFSLWSAVGLSICLGVGFQNFKAMLQGAHMMDVHFKEAPLEKNIPVVLGLLSVWYNNFFKAESEAVIPYTEYLRKLTSYLQQAVMESNGKQIDRNGKRVTYQTGTIVWGSTGTNAQHAFFQLLHQGTKLIPADFICFVESLYGDADHQNKLLANCLAQTEALMEGTPEHNNPSAFRNFEGNRPTNTLVIKKLSPKNLGSLLAMYEHKLFVQGIIWNIYSYDQWGVELGKKVAIDTLEAIEEKNRDMLHNSSTQALLRKILGN